MSDDFPAASEPDFTRFTPTFSKCKTQNRMTARGLLRILRILQYLEGGVRTAGAGAGARAPAPTFAHLSLTNRKIRKIRKLPLAVLRFYGYTEGGPRCKRCKIAPSVEGGVVA